MGRFHHTDHTHTTLFLVAAGFPATFGLSDRLLPDSMLSLSAASYHGDIVILWLVDPILLPTTTFSVLFVDWR